MILLEGSRVPALFLPLSWVLIPYFIYWFCKLYYKIQTQGRLLILVYVEKLRPQADATSPVVRSPLWNPRLPDLSRGPIAQLFLFLPVNTHRLTSQKSRSAPSEAPPPSVSEPRPLHLTLSCPAPARLFRLRPSGLPWQRVRAPRSAAARAGPRLDRGPRPGGHSCHRRRHFISSLSPSAPRLPAALGPEAGGPSPPHHSARMPKVKALQCALALEIRSVSTGPVPPQPPRPPPVPGPGDPWKCRVPAHSSLAGASPQLPAGVLSDFFHTTSELHSQGSSSLRITLYSFSFVVLLDSCSSLGMCGISAKSCRFSDPFPSFLAQEPLFN